MQIKSSVILLIEYMHIYHVHPMSGVWLAYTLYINTVSAGAYEK